MPKKKFIDKKNSVTFNLVHRSQRDPLAADSDAPQRILQPVGSNQRSKTKDASSTKRIEDNAKYGIFFDDDYDYLQHLRDPNEFKTDLVEAPKTTSTRVTKLKLPQNVFASETEEKIGLLNKAAPQTLNLEIDPDIVEAMDDDFDFDDPDNQLEDNFIELALNSDLDEGVSGEEDQDVSSNFSEEEDDEVGSLNELETKSRFTEYSLTSSVMRRNEQLTLLDKRFEKMYLDNYDDQDIGALDTEEIDNEVADTANEMLMRYIAQYEEEKQFKTYPETSSEVRTDTLKHTKDESESDEEMVYVDVTPKIEYDCQSILTLNSQNKYKHKPAIIPNLPSRKIQIHPTTGMPMNVLSGNKGLTVKSLAQFDALNSQEKKKDGKSVAESCISRITALSMRSKNENPEEKRERKHALKEYRRERRLEKKANALAFKDEKKRQEKIMLNLKQNIQGVK